MKLGALLLALVCGWAAQATAGAQIARAQPPADVSGRMVSEMLA